MGYSLYFPFVQHQSRLDQSLPVSGGTGVGDLCVGGQERMDLLHGAYSCGQGTAVVAAVKGIQKGAVLRHQGGFRGRRPCVDPEETASVIVPQVPGLYMVTGLSLVKGLVVLLRRE